MRSKTIFIYAVFPCLLSFALSIKNEGRGEKVYQTAKEAELNRKNKEAGLNPKTEEVWLNPKAREVWINPKAKEVGLNPKATGAGLNPKATEAGLNPKAKDAGLNPKVTEVVLNPKVEQVARRNGRDSQRDQTGRNLRNDATCTSAGGICQHTTYICQGRYLQDRCAGPTTRQCCVPGPIAWGVLCSSHHQNRVRGCDTFGCGAFGSKRGQSILKAVDLVCDDYSVVNAPFTGTLGGPAWWRGNDRVQYDGVKLSNSEFCVKILNVRPYRYRGGISRGEPLGYLLPLQERFSGITSHLRLQTCDRSDPSPFI